METGQGRINYEEPQVRPDGSTAWLRTSKVPLRDKEGNVVGVLGTYEDITEYKRSVEALRESEERFRNIVETTSEWIWEMNLEGHHTFSNPAAVYIMGYLPEEIRNIELMDLMHPDDRERVSGILQSSISRKEGWRNVVIRWRHKDGTWRYLESNSSPVLDSDGTLVGFRGADRDITDRILSEAALRESEEKYRTLVENAKEIVAIVQGWNILFINRKGAEILGIPEDQIMGREFLDFIWPEDVELLRNHHINREAGNEAPEAYDYRIRGAGGRPVWVFGSIARITWQGKPATLSLMTDITERKFAEAALQESEETFRRVIEGAPEAIYIGADWKFLYLNPAALRLFGATSGDQLVGTPFMDRIHPKFHDDIRKRVSGLYNERVAAPPLEEVYLMLDGSEIDVEVSSVPFRYMGKDGALVFVWNISDRKKAEHAKKESEEKFRHILESMQDAYIRTGRDGIITMVNPSAVRLYGYSSPEEMAGIPVDELYYSSGDRETVLKQLQDKKAITDISGQGRKKDGTSFWASLNVQFVCEDDGSISGTEGFIRDITERRVMEQAIEDTNRKLSLLNSITRHDISNQLTVLRGYAQLVEMSNQDPVVVDFMQKIEASTDTITSQIEFARAYQELGAHTPAWFRLDDIIAKTARSEVSFSSTCRTIEIFADPMLERVFYNIFDNALCHGEHVTTIGVRCERAPDGLVIIIEDDGIGILPGDKETIFEKGFGKHTGFGLFLARKILSITGITIRETGYAGIGARFEITVPREMWRISPAGQ
jgi:PAS domain S-box-containing protein